MDARDKQLKTPLHLACLKGYSFIVKILIDNGGDPFERDIQGRTCMHFAVTCASENAAPEIMAILSGSTTDLVHMEDHAGRTPLHYAVMNEFIGQVNVLM